MKTLTPPRILMMACILIAALLQACNSGETRSTAPDPARIHDNDEVSDNFDGTSSVTLANRTFTTSQFVMADDGYASHSTFTLTNDKTHNISSLVKDEVINLLSVAEVQITQDISVLDFAVKNQIIYAHVKSDITTTIDIEVPNLFIKNGPDMFTLNSTKESEFNSLLSISLSTNKVLSSAGVADNMQGLSLNGAILTADGSSEVSFYQVNSNKVGDNFAPIKPLGTSGKIDAVFLDHNRYYVVSEGVLFSTPLDDVLHHNDVATLIDSDISKVDAVYFAADESFIYVATVDGTKTKVQRIDKAGQVATDWRVLSFKASGIAADSSHIYISNSITNKLNIKAYTKDGTAAGEVDTTNTMSLGSIYIEGSTLYYINKKDYSLHETTITWTP